MSDMGDIYKALREHHKSEKANRLHDWEVLVSGLRVEFPKFPIKALTQNHYRADLRQGHLDYWPTTGKWALFLTGGPRPTGWRKGEDKPLTGVAIDHQELIKIIKEHR